MARSATDDAIPRRRWALAALAAVGVLLGLATRRRAEWFPHVVATYGGDVLWAAMLYWLLAFVFVRTPVRRMALVAWAAACTVEVSQLWHTPVLDALRDTTMGALVLGRGFLWSDIVCYAAGVAFAALLDLGGLHQRRIPSVTP